MTRLKGGGADDGSAADDVDAFCGGGSILKQA